MARYERYCEFCYTEFIATRRDKRFCCDACRKAAWENTAKRQNGSDEFPETVTRAEFEDLKREVERTNEKLDQVNKNLETLSGFFLRWFENQTMAPLPTNPTTIKTIPQSKPVTAPKFDDDFDFEITQAKDDGGKSSQNFFNSMMALQA